jgi:hypothetical protein
MYIIVGEDAASKLSANYTVLPLETFASNVGPVTSYCVVDAQDVPLGELPLMEVYKTYHSQFIAAMLANNKEDMEKLAGELMGKFGGQVDSFYEEILNRVS